MKRVLLVDDEPAAREHIRDSFPWTTCGCEIVGEAGNGEEALALCAVLKPDIALIDITMPVMDGMELLRRLDTEHPGVRSIMLTAHRDFTYAQQAILHKAFGYVLKAPVSMVEMKKALDRACLDLDRDLHFDRHEKSHAQMLRSYQYPLRRKFFSDVLHGLFNKQEELIREGVRLGMNLASPEHVLMICAADRLEAYAARYPDRDKSLIEYSMLEIVRETLRDTEQRPFELFPLEFGQFVLLLGGDEANSEPYDSRVQRVYRSISAPLSTYLQMGLTASYSRPFPSLTGLRKVYADTLKFAVLRFYQDRPAALDAGGPLLFQQVPAERWAECSRRLDALLKQEQPDLEDWSKEVKLLLQRFQPDPASARCLFEQLKPIVEQRFPALPAQEPSWPRFASSASLTEALAELTAYIKEQLKSRSSLRELRPEIAAAVHYIKKHLHLELTLDLIAGNVQLSPSYFGHLFKKEVGVSLIDYIVEQRVEMAKTYLTDGQYRNYELAERIGFQNYSYFCTIFKKHTGMTPNEYKNANKTKTHV
ncbi:response regulator [Paenibacillus sp. GCM10023248]|uniref:response regulator n=1 Tax=Bacillales TaxID=1385 RepID=UPI00237937A6|nr:MULTISPECIES: response regulator [Bacillales]MDD9265590.1 response regulator [Paenibacillus sp. MAHUQ-63]MDR6878828.1 AraC-like DNA-binding protein/CheY-like chemotaxis protein [Bacillus sp. 3255]